MLNKIPDGYKLIAEQLETVHPTSCLWFAWAMDDAVGPYEGNVVPYKPLTIPIDPGAGFVNVAVVNRTVQWRHGGGANEISTAEGRTDTLRGTRPAYRSATYNSEEIYATPMPLNGLVIMLGLSSKPTYELPAIQMYIGFGNVDPIAIPDPPIGHENEIRFLFIGMHDGYQWNNNKMFPEDAVMQIRVSFLGKLARPEG